MSSISIKAHSRKFKHSLVVLIALFYGLVAQAQSQREYARGQRAITHWFLNMFSRVRLRIRAPSVSHSPALPQFSPPPDPADITRMPVYLIYPQFSVQKIGQLPWHSPSFPKPSYQNLSEKTELKKKKKKLGKVCNQVTITSRQKRAEELSWYELVETDKMCGPVT